MGKDDIIEFKGETLMEIILIDHRWIIVCFFLLPMSFLYNLYFYVRNAIIFHLNSAPSAHDDKVRTIQRRVILIWTFLVRCYKYALFHPSMTLDV